MSAKIARCQCCIERSLSCKEAAPQLGSLPLVALAALLTGKPLQLGIKVQHLCTAAPVGVRSLCMPGDDAESNQGGLRGTCGCASSARGLMPPTICSPSSDRTRLQPHTASSSIHKLQGNGQHWKGLPATAGECSKQGAGRGPEGDVCHAGFKGALQVDLYCVQREALALVHAHGPAQVQRNLRSDFT